MDILIEKQKGTTVEKERQKSKDIQIGPVRGKEEQRHEQINRQRKMRGKTLSKRQREKKIRGNTLKLHDYLWMK